MNSKLQIDRKDSSGVTRITIKGIIDEDADFDKSFSDVNPTVVFDLEGVDLINSCGVREWVHAIQALPRTAKISYEKCAPRIVEQTNYVANFLGGGKVVSFFAPYYCPKCKKESNVLLNAEQFSGGAPEKAPGAKCPNCKGAMEFDDIEEEYFSFLES